MTKRKENKKNKKEELKEIKSQLARALADYDNLRKRTEREREEFQNIIKTRFIYKIFSIFDMLENAQKHLKDSGIALIIEELERIFKEEGIERIKVEPGMAFDEDYHEAVDIVKGKKGGRVVKEILTGWKFVDGDAIRPSKVIVTKEDK